MSPPTYVEPYLGDGTGRRRAGRGSSALSHHEINQITNGLYQYYFSVAPYTYNKNNPRIGILKALLFAVFVVLQSIPTVHTRSAPLDPIPIRLGCTRNVEGMRDYSIIEGPFGCRCTNYMDPS